MIGSLYSGISGLKANTSAMSVIGDNIANVNTTGFKVSTVSFSNVFNASLGQSRMQIGRGVTMSGMSANWSSGTVESSGNVTDLAINGQGMFIVQDPTGSGQYYTRAGQFEFDVDSFLVNQDGMRVQGYSVDPATGALGSLGDITMPAGMSQPLATSAVTIGMNLDAGSAVADTYDTTVTTYDSLGNPVELGFVFTKTVASPATWTYAITPSITGATAGPAAGSGTLVFDGNW